MKIHRKTLKIQEKMKSFACEKTLKITLVRTVATWAPIQISSAPIGRQGNKYSHNIPTFTVLYLTLPGVCQLLGKCICK